MQKRLNVNCQDFKSSNFSYAKILKCICALVIFSVLLWVDLTLKVGILKVPLIVWQMAAFWLLDYHTCAQAVCLDPSDCMLQKAAWVLFSFNNKYSSCSKCPIVAVLLCILYITAYTACCFCLNLIVNRQDKRGVKIAKVLHVIHQQHIVKINDSKNIDMILFFI